MTPPTKIEQKYKGVRRILRRKLKPEKVKSAKTQKAVSGTYDIFDKSQIGGSVYTSRYSGNIQKRKFIIPNCYRNSNNTCYYT